MSVVPNGYTTVAPWIVTSDTRALLDFVARVFDGTNAGLVPLEDGSIGHALRTEGPRAPQAKFAWVTPSCSRLTAARAGRHFPRYCACSWLTPTRQPLSPSRPARRWSHLPPRAPSGNAAAARAMRDLFGNIWWISTIVEEVPPDEAFRRLSEPVFAEAMRDAQETLDRERSGRRQGVASRPVTPRAG
jgi:PhnB protein